jgi:transposase
MPWDESTRMRQRARFLLELSSCLYTMTELCTRFGISRKTGYKWADRFAEEESFDLRDRSRRPRSCPHRTPEAVEAQLVELRRSIRPGVRSSFVRACRTSSPRSSGRRRAQSAMS